LFAHEWAHLLGLIGHVAGRNLMNGLIRNGATDLQPEQIATINQSPLIVDGILTLQFILLSR